MASERAIETRAPSGTGRPLRAARRGVLVGGSGLVGGTLLNHFKTGDRGRIDVLSPNSKELSLRVPDDIRSYFERIRPDFIVNCAIAAIDSDPQLTFEVNCLGTIYLARAAQELGIPYIHLSSAALVPNGEDLGEDARLELDPGMPNYAKGKLLAELALEHMHRTRGLDYTDIRLAVVYGAHDHKIQGFHRLLFSLVDRAMPVLLTRKGARHSYTNAKKLPAFVSHVLDHRSEFSGQTYHFVDPEPVRLGELVLTIRDLVGSRTPRRIYVPYALARLGMAVLTRLARLVSRVGIEARPPAERVFLRNFYESQTLSAAKLQRSSFVDPDPGATIYSELPALLDYYVPRWERLNLIRARSRSSGPGEGQGEQFFRAPDELLGAVLAEQDQPFLQQCSLVKPAGDPQDPAGAPPERAPRPLQRVGGH